MLIFASLVLYSALANYLQRIILMLLAWLQQIPIRRSINDSDVLDVNMILEEMH